MDKFTSNNVVQSLAHVTSHSDRELLEASLSQTLFELLSVPRVLLYTIYHENNQVKCVCSIKIDSSQSIVLGENFANESVAIDSIPGLEGCLNTKDIICSEAEDESFVILYPITDQFERVIRVFRIDRAKQEQKVDFKFISDFFQIYKNYIQLLNECEIDTLTGLLNRRTFDRDLQKTLTDASMLSSVSTVKDDNRRQVTEEKISHWLAVADIDYFKRINDNFGHLYGDEVLLLLANLMRKTFRASDMLFRFGGEEFVIILRSMNEQGANHALERFRTTIEEFEFPQVGHISISIGYVELQPNSMPTELLGYADEALYYSKDNGRNQVNQYEVLLNEGKVAKHQAVVDDIELF